MKMWTEIRRLVLTEKKSKRAICQEYGIHWKTLEKILAHEEPPGYRQKERPTPVPVRAKACTAKSLPRFGGSSQSNASALSLSIVHFFTSSSAVRRTAALATASNRAKIRSKRDRWISCIWRQPIWRRSKTLAAFQIRVGHIQPMQLTGFRQDERNTSIGGGAGRLGHPAGYQPAR